MSEPFEPWAKTVVHAAASLLESEIPGAARGRTRKLGDSEAVYVHFRDAHLPQTMAVWLYAAREGTAYNVRNCADVIGVGLKHDPDEELDRAVWKFRRLSLFTWQHHIDDRHEGLRWMCRVSDLPDDAQAASEEIVGRVLGALRRAGAVAKAP